MKTNWHFVIVIILAVMGAIAIGNKLLHKSPKKDEWPKYVMRFEKSDRTFVLHPEYVNDKEKCIGLGIIDWVDTRAGDNLPALMKYEKYKIYRMGNPNNDYGYTEYTPCPKIK